LLATANESVRSYRDTLMLTSSNLKEKSGGNAGGDSARRPGPLSSSNVVSVDMKSHPASAVKQDQRPLASVTKKASSVETVLTKKNLSTR